MIFPVVLKHLAICFIQYDLNSRILYFSLSTCTLLSKITITILQNVSLIQFFLVSKYARLVCLFLLKYSGK